jgi:hypothetical protein
MINTIFGLSFAASAIAAERNIRKEMKRGASFMDFEWFNER